jgi:hypothetical protein
MLTNHKKILLLPHVTPDSYSTALLAECKQPLQSQNRRDRQALERRTRPAGPLCLCVKKISQDYSSRETNLSQSQCRVCVCVIEGGPLYVFVCLHGLLTLNRACCQYWEERCQRCWLGVTVRSPHSSVLQQMQMHMQLTSH